VEAVRVSLFNLFKGRGVKMKATRHIILFSVALVVSMQCAAEQSSVSDVIRHATVRIETQKNGKTKVGTGFFYLFSSNIPAVVTCRHVVEGAEVGRLFFSPVEKGTSEEQAEAAIPMDIRDFGSACITHPDKDVDLAIYPLGPLMSRLESQGKQQIVFAPLSAANVPNHESLQTLGSFTDIKVVGYPIGIWDAVNNRSVVRRGIMATDLELNYNGRSQFLIDAEVLPGSSGSPVLVAHEGVFSYKGRGCMGSRLYLLGILFATPEYDTQGELSVKTIPTAFKAEERVGNPSNLGIVIKAQELGAFEKLLEQRMKP
jgi:hypothetical protein